MSRTRVRIPFLEFCLATAVLVSVLYGTTFQEFRRFADAYIVTLEKGEAVSGDRGFYMAMSEKLTSNEAANWRNYRIVVPWLVHYTSAFAEKAIGKYAPGSRREIQFSATQVRPLLFYLYNFLFFYLALMLLYVVLRNLGFDLAKSLLGCVVVASSRVVSYSIGSPLVDSVLYCAISFMVYLTFCDRTVLRTKLLFLLYPVVMISKEMIIPIAALPFLLRRFRTPYFFVMFLVSVAGYFALRFGIDLLYDSPKTPASHGESLYFANILAAVLPMIPANLRGFLTISGMDHLLHGFIFFVPMAVAGAFLPSRLKLEDKLVLNGLVAIAVGYAILSYESGRMLFSAFPAIVIYALVFIEFVEARIRRMPRPADVAPAPKETVLP